uniref:Cilia and flagella associated protein 119 n=1 Tax=Sparus aurata TaxID=8175 RepID=A0A671W691_SPAAU
SVLCSVFGVDLPEPKRGVLLELYVQAVLFCRERNFKKEQTSALLSIIKLCIFSETPLNNIEQSFKYCKELLLCHSVRRPPFSINLFSSEEVTGILNYIFNSYVRHYKLYKYIFTPQVKLDLSLTYSGTPNQEEATIEDSSALVTPKWCSCFIVTASLTGSKSGLKALIENEVREQMMLVSGQLDQRMKEIADQHNRALESPQLNHKAKK